MECVKVLAFGIWSMGTWDEIWWRGKRREKLIKQELMVILWKFHRHGDLAFGDLKSGIDLFLPKSSWWNPQPFAYVASILLFTYSPFILLSLCLKQQSARLRGDRKLFRPVWHLLWQHTFASENGYSSSSASPSPSMPHASLSASGSPWFASVGDPVGGISCFCRKSAAASVGWRWWS